MKTIRVAALNLVMPPPHSPGRYVELLKYAFRLHKAVDLRGDYKGMLGGARGDESLVQGELYKFFDLDLGADWFNLSRRQQAEDDELAKIRIPDNLKPHHHSFDFVFLPRYHRLIHVSRDASESLSPKVAQKLLLGVFRQPAVVERFGEISVTVEPTRERLRELLSLPRLKSIKVELRPPNPDDLEDAEKEVFDRMMRQRANIMTIELKTEHEKGLAPDENIETLARIAQSNGTVKGKGENDQGRTIDFSTSDHPLVVPIVFDPDVELRSAALVRESPEIMKQIRDRN